MTLIEAPQDRPLTAWLRAILGFIVATAFAMSALAQSIPDEARLKWSRDFVREFQSKRTWRELLERAPIPAEDRGVLLRIFADRPLPKASFDGESIRVGSADLRVLDLAGRQFRFNGKAVTLKKNASFLETVKMFAETETLKQSLFERFFASIAFAAEGFNKRLITQQELLMSDPTRITDHELAWLAFGIDKLSLPLSGGLAADYLLTKAESMLTPSCDQQVARLRSLLEEQKLAFSEMDCGESYRGNDRTIGFWKWEGKKAVKETYYCDFRLQGIELKADEEDNKKDNVALLFNNDSLKEVRVLKTVESYKQRYDYKPGMAQFDDYQKKIEPIRKVLHFIGSNRTCDKCYSQVQKMVAATAPNSIKPAATSTPAGPSKATGSSSGGVK